MSPSTGNHSVSAQGSTGNPHLGQSPGPRGVTLLAALLIFSPLLQWLYLTVLAQFTLLEPPFSRSGGLALAMQLFFAPGNVLGVVVGVGLFKRSERMRRFARLLFLISLALSAWQLGAQVVAWRFSSNTSLSATTLLIAATYLWYFGRPGVKAQFQVQSRDVVEQQAAAAGIGAAQGRAVHPRALAVCACVEILVCVAAAAMTAHLWTTFTGETLLDGWTLAETPAGEELLRMFLFVIFALFLSPHLLTAVASVGILLGRDTTAMARRYGLVTCWTMIGCLLLTAWLVSHAELAFDVRNGLALGAFSGVSFVWHLYFLHVLARSRLAANVAAKAGRHPR